MNSTTKANSADYDSVSSIAAMTAVGLAGSSIAIILPSLIESLVQSRGLTTAAAASVMSGEMLGMTVSTAAIAPLVQRFNRRSLAASALAVCASADFLCLGHVSATAPLYALRLAAGLGEGALIAVVAAALGGTRVPDRNFGIFIAANMLLSAILFRAVPLIVASYGINGVFSALIVLAGWAAFSLPFFPARAREVAAGATGAATVVPKFWNLTAILALAGFLIFYTAVGTVWPLLPYFAHTLEVADSTVARTMSDATIAGLLAALLASYLGARWGRALPLFVGGLVLIGSMALVPLVGGPAFWVAAAALMGAWMFSAPYYLATLAAADGSGRAVAFSMSLQFCGLTIGPLIGPRITDSVGGFGAVWAGVALVALAVALIASACARVR